MSVKYAEVIVSITSKEVDRVFHYGIPERLECKVKIGSRVMVPFGNGNKRIEGYVIGFTSETGIQPEKIKLIHTILDEKQVFSDEMLALAIWMKDKYFSSMAECLRCIIPSGILSKSDAKVAKKVTVAYLNPDAVETDVSGKEVYRQIFSLLRSGSRLKISDIKEQLNISDSPLKTLEKKGVICLEQQETLRDAFYEKCLEQTIAPVLNEEQVKAVEAIEKMPSSRPVLIHGVTGSGKTEIYMSLIKTVLNKGMQAIMLVPEISLTPQTVNVFYGRFGDKVTVTHSRLSVGERYDQWKKARDGSVSIMIGPRSAIFAPFDRLGIIIIDEEHENTYKSEISPKYSAKEIALWRSQRSGAKLVLGSATPSLETYYSTQINQTELVCINQRINRTLPDIVVVDMRKELEAGNRSAFSRGLYEAMAENLNKAEQTILFLNRRGHSTFVSCRKCGYVMKCKDCSVNYTYHVYDGKLVCHYCGDRINNPDNCPACGSKYIKYFGIGTQKLEEEVRRLFPAAGVLRMDFDTTAGKHGHEKILGMFRRGEANILIGTQMIAKGLDFPNVSLVGIVAADLSLNNGDFRAGETTYQLLTQVSGRAGRAETSGNVFIQTYNPEHYSIIYACENNYRKFYSQEIALRRQMMYPPFSKIFLVLFTGEDEKNIIVNMYKLLDIMKKYNTKTLFEIIGPAPAIIFKVKKIYRWKLFIKATDEERLKNFVLYCVEKLKTCSDMKDISIQLTLNPLIML